MGVFYHLLIVRISKQNIRTDAMRRVIQVIHFTKFKSKIQKFCGHIYHLGNLGEIIESFIEKSVERELPLKCFNNFFEQLFSNPQNLVSLILFCGKKMVL